MMMVVMMMMMMKIWVLKQYEPLLDEFLGVMIVDASDKVNER